MPLAGEPVYRDRIPRLENRELAKAKLCYLSPIGSLNPQKRAGIFVVELFALLPGNIE